MLTSTAFHKGSHSPSLTYAPSPKASVIGSFCWGERVQVFDTRGGWSFVRAQKDGYVGYLIADQLGAVHTATHWVSAAMTHLYPQADFKVK